MEPMNNFLIKRTKQLTLGLILSCGLNVALLLALFLVWKGMTTPRLSLEQIEARVDELSPNKAMALTTFLPLSYDQLITHLSDKEQVEDGFTQRDIALGCLVSKHYFNIAKALPGTLLQSRKFVLGSDNIILFSGLNDEQIKKVTEYASTEKWPLTSQGLFLKLKEIKEPSLKSSFYTTREYVTLETLARGCGLEIPKEQLLQMIMEGSFEKLQEVSSKGSLDFSNSCLQKILMEYVEGCSQSAADILVENYPEFACKKLDDPSVILLLRQLKRATPAAENYAKEMLVSPRSRVVWHTAALRLYQFHGEIAPKNFDYRAAVSHFVIGDVLSTNVMPVSKTYLESTPVKEKDSLVIKKSEKRQFLHVVRQGESLWTIGKHYHIERDILKKHNALKSDNIREGQVLIIP